MPVKLTRKQREAARLIGDPVPNVMLFGGSRSGKTFLLCWRIVHNAVSCPGIRQAVFRKHFNTVRTAVGQDTLPKVMELGHFSGRFRFDARDNVFRCDNGNEIWLLGLDDKERTEKVLGKEFHTVYFNECSEISWAAVQMAMTRIAQQVTNVFGNIRRSRLYFDCNPPSKSHWTFLSFVQKTNPITRLPWKHPERWASMKLNPADNAENINREYIPSVLNEFTGKARQRFLLGEWTDDTENALWKRAMIDGNRLQQAPADLQRIVVGVDPAVTNSDCSFLRR